MHCNFWRGNNLIRNSIQIQYFFSKRNLGVFHVDPCYKGFYLELFLDLDDNCMWQDNARFNGFQEMVQFAPKQELSKSRRIVQKWAAEWSGLPQRGFPSVLSPASCNFFIQHDKQPGLVHICCALISISRGNVNVNCRFLSLSISFPFNDVWGKIIFSEAFVCPWEEGVSWCNFLLWTAPPSWTAPPPWQNHTPWRAPSTRIIFRLLVDRGGRGGRIPPVNKQAENDSL